MAESQKEKLMRTLGITAEEADELIAYDNDVEHNKKTQYDLSPEKMKETRKYRQADRKPTGYKWTKRERKPNEAKRTLINEIFEFLKENVENCTVSNQERQIDFDYCGENFSITLTQHRKNKKS